MNFEEHAAKPLLEAAGIAIPRGRLARSAGEAEAVASHLAVPVVVKAQAPTGGGADARCGGGNGGAAGGRGAGRGRGAALGIAPR